MFYNWRIFCNVREKKNTRKCLWICNVLFDWIKPTSDDSLWCLNYVESKNENENRKSFVLQIQRKFNEKGRAKVELNWNLIRFICSEDFMYFLNDGSYFMCPTSVSFGVFFFFLGNFVTGKRYWLIQGLSIYKIIYDYSISTCEWHLTRHSSRSQCRINFNYKNELFSYALLMDIKTHIYAIAMASIFPFRKINFQSAKWLLMVSEVRGIT